MALSSPPPPLPDYLRWITGPLVEALEGVHIGLLIMYDDGASHRIAYSSVYNASLTGHTPEELVGTDSFGRVPPEELPRLAERRERARRGEPQPRVMETTLLHKDGTTRVPIEVGTTRVQFEGKQVVIAFNRDIRERKQVEEALRRSELRFRQLIEEAPQAICALREGVFVYVNPALVQAFGCRSAGEIVHRPVSDFFLEALPASPAARAESVPREYRVRRPDGALVTMEVDLIAADFEGAPSVLGFARDVTDRNRLQEQLLQADRMATVGMLAAGVAHEINNPLAYVALILDDLGRGLATLRQEPARVEERIPALLDLVGEARGGAERVGVIIRDLRTFARPAAEQSDVAEVDRVLESAIKIAQNDIRHRARLLVELAEPLPPVAASEARLGQVFLNLLVNAVQAIPDGAPERHQIRVAARVDRGRVQVEVSDTGTGIAPEHMARIFDPFFSTKDPRLGTGLGLSVCKSIVVGLGGDIAVSSRAGEGTTFTVSLPVADARGVEVVPPAPPPAPATPAPRRLRILIVDDEPLLAKALARELGDEHEVSIATGGRRALELMLAEDYDLVLCDVMMPDLSGLELFDELRQRRPGVERTLAFMTGGMFTPRAQDFLERIDNPRVEKPFDMNEVREIIRAMARPQEPRASGSP